MTKLNAKQAKFVREYLVDLNATQAAIRAGYSEKSASEIGYENLRKPHIAAAVDKAMAEEPGITRARIVDELAKIAFASAGDFFEWGPDGVEIKPSEDLTDEQRAVVSEVSQTVTEKGGTTRIKLSDKQAALEKLGRALGMFKDRVEHTGKDGGPIDVLTRVLDEIDEEMEILPKQKDGGQPVNGRGANGHDAAEQE